MGLTTMLTPFYYGAWKESSNSWYILALTKNEPTSPKKPKSIPGAPPSHGPGEATSPLPSEWTSVRISPGEDTAGKDLLAVRVLVTSEDSSSDTESDWENSKDPSAKASAKKPPRPESPPLPKPITRHISLREPLTMTALPQCPEEPRVAHGLQRANSFQSSTPSKYQNWRRTFQSNLTPTDKRTLSPPKEPPLQSSWSSLSSSLPSSSSSASVSALAPEDSSLPQVTAHNGQSQASRDHCSPAPIYLRRAKVLRAPKEIPLYLPHGPVLERAEYCLVSPGADSLKSPAQVASGGCQEAKAPLGDTKSTHQDPYPVRKKDESLPDQKLSLRAGEDPTEGNPNRPRRGQEGGSELVEESRSGMKKLVLTPEQKTMLLDWNDANSESVGLKAGEHIAWEGGKRARVLKPIRPLSLPQAGKEQLPCQAEAQDQMRTPAVRAPGERSMPPPKSPLRLIANAIRRSLFPNSDAGKKAWAKAESKTSPTSQPHACTRSFSLRKPSSNNDRDPQSPGRHMAKRASAFFSLGSPTARNAPSMDLSPPDTTLRTHSLPNRPSKMFPAPTAFSYSKIEDVPMLMEKVSLQETLPGPVRSPKAKIPFFSSLRIKDKSFESCLQESRQRKDIRDLFGRPQGKATPGNNVSALEKLPQPPRSTSLGQAAHLPSVAADASSKHTPVGAQVSEMASSPSSTSTSSADEELDPQLSSRLKEKKMLQRRKKLEKATRQLVKQEELKRLHKAQAIQRQLEEVEERQKASEIQGVRLEKALRGEADSGTQDEAQLLQEWFKLVLEKNKLMRYESELLIMAQELELEDHQSRLEQKLREKMLKEESQKDEKDKNEEQEILNKMMQVIEQRDRLVDSLEEQRIKEKAEDQNFESFVFSRGCLLSRT